MDFPLFYSYCFRLLLLESTYTLAWHVLVKGQNPNTIIQSSSCHNPRLLLIHYSFQHSSHSSALHYSFNYRCIHSTLLYKATEALQYFFPSLLVTCIPSQPDFHSHTLGGFPVEIVTSGGPNTLVRISCFLKFRQLRVLSKVILFCDVLGSL